jgi:hypothetical protein
MGMVSAERPWSVEGDTYLLCFPLNPCCETPTDPLVADQVYSTTDVLRYGAAAGSLLLCCNRANQLVQRPPSHQQRCSRRPPMANRRLVQLEASKHWYFCQIQYT